MGDASKTIKTGEKVVNLYKQIKTSLKKIDVNDIDVLKNLFPDNFSAKVDKGIKEIDRFFKKIEEKRIKGDSLAVL
jgi:hypothetical protein